MLRRRGVLIVLGTNLLIFIFCYSSYSPFSSKDRDDVLHNNNTCDDLHYNSSPYSSVRCIELSPTTKSCDFRNVCFGPEEGRGGGLPLLFLVPDPKDFTSPSSSSSHPPPSLLWFSRPPNAYFQRVLNITTVTPSSFKSIFQGVDQQHLEGTSVLFPATKHHGHIEVDIIFPTAMLMNLHRVKDHGHSSYNIFISKLGPEDNSTFVNDHLLGILQRPIRWETPGTCMDRLLVGVVGITGVTRKAPPTLPHDAVDRFRHWIEDEMRLTPIDKPLRKVLLVDRKCCSRKIHNASLLLLQEELIKIVAPQRWSLSTVFLEDFSFLKQIELTRDVGVLIGVSGTGLHSTLYMAPHTASVEITLSTPGARINDDVCRHSPTHLCLWTKTSTTYYIPANQTTHESMYFSSLFLLSLLLLLLLPPPLPTPLHLYLILSCYFFFSLT
jgi:hypothetical protein